MAKGQVSEEELSKGLKGIGNFGGLSQTRVRRDNPFRDSRTDGTPPEPVKTVDLRQAVPEERIPEPAEPQVPTPEPKVLVRRVGGTAKPVAKEPKEKGNREAGASRKADIFTERVTLQISPAMRDEVERIARELLRAKVSKKERITGNTVMRVAIRLVTEHFQLNAGEVPNDEDELFKSVERELTRRQR